MPQSPSTKASTQADKAIGFGLNIQKLKLRDYRCFEFLYMEFHPQLTVLVAPNGVGKTAVLDAIAVALGPYVGAFDEGASTHFHPSDIRLRKVRDTASHEMEYAPRGVSLWAVGYIPNDYPGSLMAKLGEVGDANVKTKWQRGLSGPTKAKTTIKNAKELIDYGKAMQAAVKNGEEVLLPVLAYYGTGRLWLQKKQTKGKSSSSTRNTRGLGYTDCLDPGSSYKLFLDWFKYWSTCALDARFKAHEKGQPYQATEFDDHLAAVTAAVNACLAPTGWKDIAYSVNQEDVVMRHDVHGELPLGLLSDGIRNMVAMVADIAFRASKLNPHLGANAARQTPGVVLVDEVDMHLHPEWQQCVLQGLMAAFPAVQWVVSTHSPQVLSTIKPENIRIIGQDPDGKWFANPPLAATYGLPSGDVLHSVMGINPQPPVPEHQDLQRLTALVDQGQYQCDEAQQLLQQLEASLGCAHPQLLRLRRSIERQTLLKR